MVRNNFEKSAGKHFLTRCLYAPRRGGAQGRALSIPGAVFIILRKAFYSRETEGSFLVYGAERVYNPKFIS
ncbi:hypothetical protein MNBD_GAMMA10-1356 [hydrothermal vent metagenome]|uniref:Uncharacterized protein n=1 Tax=hydrothermal vent metagenome TaxID=652676 RepID=A0A3B0Y7F7_9ZZZZ